MELRKDWEDGSGDVLSVTYTGEKTEDVPFSSSVNEGLDRTVSVSFLIGESTYAERNVVQAGKREAFDALDGGFTLLDGGTFNVLKNGVQQ